MRAFPRPWSLKRAGTRAPVLAPILIGLLAVIAADTILVAQDPGLYFTADVARVGDRLACRCGGCRNTVGNCPMIKCSSADPKRHRIFEMKKAGMSDDAIVNTIVNEEGAVALSSPPAGSVGGILTWIMPGIALIAGFFIYLRYVRRNQSTPVPLTAADRTALERFRSQIENNLEEEEHRER